MNFSRSIAFIAGFLIILIFSGSSIRGGRFELTFFSVGMGSNFASMQPVFTVKGNEFTYSSVQTGYHRGNPVQENFTPVTGKFRQSSIDSIIGLTENMSDTMIYETNAHIMSGVIHHLSIRAPGRKTVFRLHNASHPTAKKIIQILNTYVPKQDQKLWLFDLS